MRHHLVTAGLTGLHRLRSQGEVEVEVEVEVEAAQAADCGG